MSKPAKKQDKPRIPVPDLTQGLDEATKGKILSLPEQEQKHLHGMALWLNGHSMLKAAELAGVPRNTLRYRIERAGLSDLDRNKMAEAVLDISWKIGREAGSQLYESLLAGDIPARELYVNAGTFIDKVTRVYDLQLKAEQLAKPAPESDLHKLLEALHTKGGRFTLGYEPPEQKQERTIDTTATEESEDV